jgi:hypothetical protein
VELTELANFWQEVPALLLMGVLDVFFLHLDESKVPITPDPSASQSQIADRAFMALLGVSKAGAFLEDKMGEGISKGAMKAWPGIFKWSAFLFVARVQTPGVHKQIKRSTIDIISSCWYAVSRDDDLCKIMASTVGCIEIAAKLWVLEDDGPVPSSVNLPAGSAALYSLLKTEDISLLDRIVKACGGKAKPVVSLAITRLHSATNDGQKDGIRVTILIDLINRLSRNPKHPLRTAFLSGHIIHIVTKTLATAASQINTTGDLTLLDSMVAGFGYLWNYLESTDGVTWILQSLRAGFLTAFVECSPHFGELDSEDLSMVVGIVKDILPRYLVYRTVIEAVDAAMLKIQKSPYMHAVSNGIVKNEWNKFHRLSLERLMVTLQAGSSKDKVVACDNVKVRCFYAFYCRPKLIK